MIKIIKVLGGYVIYSDKEVKIEKDGIIQDTFFSEINSTEGYIETEKPKSESKIKSIFNKLNN